MSILSKIASMIVSMVSKEEALHISVSAIVAAVFKVLCIVAGFSYLVAAIIAFAVTLIIGILKELTDEKFDWRDSLADVIGCIVGVA